MNKDKDRNKVTPLEELPFQERIIRKYKIDDGTNRRNLFEPGFRENKTQEDTGRRSATPAEIRKQLNKTK